jgi:hypothetical protein
MTIELCPAAVQWLEQVAFRHQRRGSHDQRRPPRELDDEEENLRQIDEPQRAKGVDQR